MLLLIFDSSPWFIAPIGTIMIFGSAWATNSGLIFFQKERPAAIFCPPAKVISSLNSVPAPGVKIVSEVPPTNTLGWAEIGIFETLDLIILILLC